MKRVDLEKHLGEFVEIKLSDSQIIKGCLRKTRDEMFKHDVNLYFPKNLYFITQNVDSKICISRLFKCSDVVRVIRIYEEAKEGTKMRCKNYVCIACVDGTCPKANIEEYEERCIPTVSKCDECFYYKGCEGCDLYGTEYCNKN